MVRVGNGDACFFQIADGAGDISGGHAIPRIIIEQDDEDACVMTLCGKDNKIVQGFEVIGVTC